MSRTDESLTRRPERSRENEGAVQEDGKRRPGCIGGRNSMAIWVANNEDSPTCCSFERSSPKDELAERSPEKSRITVNQQRDRSDGRNR